MSAFEYLFSFYGLLLGLAVANVATGFGEMWRDRRSISIGVCTPLLALIVLLGGMNIWMVYWAGRDGVTLDTWRMIAAAGVAMPYVFISRAMFPAPGGATSMEEHYLEHRKALLVALAISPIVSAGSNILLSGGSYHGWMAAWIGLRIAAPLLLVPIAHRIGQRIGLTALIALLAAGLFRW